MHRRFTELKAKDSGFTLIELLIVIIILGVLAAIVVFSVRNISDSGNTAACQSDLATVTSALEAYYAQNNAYPGTLDALWTGTSPLIKSPPTDAAAFQAAYNSTDGEVASTVC